MAVLTIPIMVPAAKAMAIPAIAYINVFLAMLILSGLPAEVR